MGRFDNKAYCNFLNAASTSCMVLAGLVVKPLVKPAMKAISIPSLVSLAWTSYNEVEKEIGEGMRELEKSDDLDKALDLFIKPVHGCEVNQEDLLNVYKVWKKYFT